VGVANGEVHYSNKRNTIEHAVVEAQGEELKLKFSGFTT
jgi:hypothetical protein